MQEKEAIGESQFSVKAKRQNKQKSLRSEGNFLATVSIQERRWEIWRAAKARKVEPEKSGSDKDRKEKLFAPATASVGTWHEGSIVGE